MKTNHNEFPIPESMKAWVLGDPGQLSIGTKPVPVYCGPNDLGGLDAWGEWKGGSGARTCKGLD